MPRIINGNAKIPDYTAIYDSISNTKIFGALTKKILLRKTLEEIIRGFPLEKVKLYSNRFQEIDSSAFVSLANKYRLNYDNSAELTLIDIDGKNISFDSLLKLNEGNLLYVDFWASWCGPDSTKWQRSSKKFHLENSFLIDNRYSSKLIKELDVASIPRYLLYDKRGNLVHKNAPRPQGESIRKLIDDYLKRD